MLTVIPPLLIAGRRAAATCSRMDRHKRFLEAEKELIIAKVPFAFCFPRSLQHVVCIWQLPRF